MSVEGNAVFLTWNDSRRSDSLARRIGLSRMVLVPHLRGLRRHVWGSVVTMWYLMRVQPTVIWYQFSLGLGLVIALYALVCRKRVVIVADLHTKAMRRSGSGLLKPLILRAKRWSLGLCCATLVTNQENASYVRRTLGVEAYTLPDPLPAPPPMLCRTAVAFGVIAVCSFAKDEPLDVIEEVASRLHPHITMAITGDYRNVDPAVVDRLSRVAVLTGWLSEADYWEYLRKARAVLVLSTEKACVPCGAYEAIAVGQRPIVNDDPYVRHAFGSAAFYTELDAANVERATRAVLAGQDLAYDAPAAIEAGWSTQWKSLRAQLISAGAVISS